MGRTLRKNLKKTQLAPFIIYLLRKWKRNVDTLKKIPETPTVSTPISIATPKSWADWDDDDDELPMSPFMDEIETPKNPWFQKSKFDNLIDNHVNEKLITFIQEYKYRNS